MPEKTGVIGGLDLPEKQSTQEEAIADEVTTEPEVSVC